jgi:hypothetical protein
LIVELVERGLCAREHHPCAGRVGIFVGQLLCERELRVEVVREEQLVEFEQHALAVAGFRRALLRAFERRVEFFGGEGDGAEVYPGVSEVRVCGYCRAEEIVGLRRVAAVKSGLARVERKASFRRRGCDGDFLHRGKRSEGCGEERQQGGAQPRAGVRDHGSLPRKVSGVSRYEE